MMTKILGKAEATAEQMAAYLLSVNPAPQISMTVKDFCQLYLDQGAKEGVRGDALFAQSCKETGNYKYRGTVKPEQHNFAGLGTVGTGTPGASFPDDATGILAQAQHAKAYATLEPLSCPCVDPRYGLLIKYGKAGTAECWEELGGKWAVPGYDTKKYKSLQEADVAQASYGYQVIKILDKILQMPKEENKLMEKKKIIALDAGHGMTTAGKRCLKSLDPNETREWWLNDRIMDKLEASLAAYDCTVLRVDDTTGAKDISLSSRVKTANKAEADAYIAMHHNGGLYGRLGGGTVVYYYDASCLAAAKRLYDAVVAETGLTGNRSSKVKFGDFYVLRNTSMPALLVENGFMDSPTDVPIILSESHAEKTAQGVLSYLVSELHLCKAGNPVQTSPALGDSVATSQQQAAASLPYITVAKGDNLTKIARKFGVGWKELASVNGLESPYTIRVGQKLRIPSKATQIYYPAYTGKKTTLTAALTSLGINSTYGYRKQIAAANGISGYIGTAAQNTRIYNLLVAGLLKAK